MGGVGPFASLGPIEGERFHNAGWFAETMSVSL